MESPPGKSPDRRTAASPLQRFLSERQADHGRRSPAAPHYVGEVIESSTTEFMAEARELHGAPAFGGFVRVGEEPPIVGIVFNIVTHSIEPNRRPVAYGKTERELRLEQPQIFALLRTEFQALTIGYLGDRGPVRNLPPQPARIHSFVQLCQDAEVRAFTDTEDYLRRILNAARIPTDELVVAVLRHSFQARDHARAYLVGMGKQLSRLLGEDYDRLSSILRRAAQ